MLGSGFRVIAPSRFGYFGSTLPTQRDPADQADAYALLLDHLGIDRAAIIAYSAGSASVLEFALRHPDRVVGADPGQRPPRRAHPQQAAETHPGCRVRLGAAVVALPEAACRRCTRGWWRPQGLPADPRGRGHLRAVSELQFPLKPRKLGRRSSTGSCPTWSPTGSPSRS